MTEEIFNIRYSFEHGGNIYRLAEEFKIQERRIIDFSASINPLGVSKKIKAELRKHLKYLHNYPDTDTKRLRKRLAQYHGIDPEMILCGNGSTELIYLITRALNPQKVLIPAPTFSEYERAVVRAQSTEHRTQIKYFILKREDNFNINPDEFIEAMTDLVQHSKNSLNSGFCAPCSVNMAFLCNPNNPTGRLLKKDAVLKIAGAAQEIKCYLIIDEAFIDFCQGTVPILPPRFARSVNQGQSPCVESGLSLIPNVQDNPYLIVLRSMTKFYALSGLRIGYGIFPQNLTGRLKEYKEPWTVNSLAQRAAVVALKDRVYRNETFKLIKEEKRFLENGFRKIGIEVFHSDVNFYLLKISNANEIYQHMKRKGILVRDCSNFRELDSTYIRVAVKSHKENTILIKELAEILQK